MTLSSLVGGLSDKRNRYVYLNPVTTKGEDGLYRKSRMVYLLWVMKHIMHMINLY